MYRAHCFINIPFGLHARAASLFVKEANKYESKIYVEKEKRTYNAKSIMGILSLGAKDKEKVEILAEGKDQEEAVCALKNLLEKELKDIALV